MHFCIDFYPRSTSSRARQYLFTVPTFPAQPKYTAHLLQGVYTFSQFLTTKPLHYNMIVHVIVFSCYITIEIKFITSLWHNSLITISIFREFRTQTIHQSYNLFVNYLDEDIPAMFRGILHTGSVENCNEIFS